MWDFVGPPWPFLLCSSRMCLALCSRVQEASRHGLSRGTVAILIDCLLDMASVLCSESPGGKACGTSSGHFGHSYCFCLECIWLCPSECRRRHRVWENRRHSYCGSFECICHCPPRAQEARHVGFRRATLAILIVCSSRIWLWLCAPKAQVARRHGFPRATLTILIGSVSICLWLWHPV